MNRFIYFVLTLRCTVESPMTFVTDMNQGMDNPCLEIEMDETKKVDIPDTMNGNGSIRYSMVIYDIYIK